jgi:hypothetical protein
MAPGEQRNKAQKHKGRKAQIKSRESRMIRGSLHSFLLPSGSIRLKRYRLLAIDVR